MDLFKLVGTVIVETQEAIDSLQDTSEEAKKTGEEISEAGDVSQKSGNSIVGSFGKVAKAGAAVVAVVVAIGTAMVQVSENTREYRLEMGKLETAFRSAGHSTEEATATYQELYSILGETDRAVEASQHIARLCSNEEEMKAMTEACIGAFATFDDSLPVEGLVEAANETAKTGQLTGVLADALNWAGSSEAEFQKKLNACNSERERTNLIIAEMNSLYGSAASAYKKNNKDVIAATKAQEKLNAATAKWGAICEPIVTVFKEGLASAIDAAADAFEYLIDPAGAAGSALAGTSKTSEEAAEKVAQLEGQLKELADIPAILWTQEHTQQQAALSSALVQAKSEYEALAEAERIAAETAQESTTTTTIAVDVFSGVAAQYVADATALFEQFAATYEGIYNKVSSWFEPFEKARVTVTTSIEAMMTAMQSQIDFNTNYSANLQALKDYGLGSLAEAFQSYGAEGAAYASTIVKAVEQAGGATTKEGQEIIKGFADINKKVTESQGELTQTMATMSGEFEAELQAMVETYGAAIDDLDKSTKSKQAATRTFEAFLEGINNEIPGILSTMTSFGEQITESLQRGIDEITIPFEFGLPDTYEPDGSHASGLDYVPFDGYIAELHRGEMVVPAAEASAIRSGGSGAVVNSDAVNLLVSILDTLQDIREQDTVLKLNNREFGRAVRGVVNA